MRETAHLILIGDNIMLLYGQDDHLDDNCNPDNRHWEDNHVPQWTTLKKQHALRGRIKRKLYAELDEARAEVKELKSENESLKNAHQDLVDRIIDLIKEKGDES
jgi:predicted transcriptional regulator